MTIRKIVEYIFFSLLSMIGTFGVSYIKDISETLNKLTTNVMQLNARIEIMTERMVEVDSKVKDHEKRLRKIERIN